MSRAYRPRLTLSAEELLQKVGDETLAADVGRQAIELTRILGEDAVTVRNVMMVLTSRVLGAHDSPRGLTSTFAAAIVSAALGISAGTLISAKLEPALTATVSVGTIGLALAAFTSWYGLELPARIRRRSPTEATSDFVSAWIMFEGAMRTALGVGGVTKVADMSTENMIQTLERLRGFSPSEANSARLLLATRNGVVHRLEILSPGAVETGVKKALELCQVLANASRAEDPLLV